MKDFTVLPDQLSLLQYTVNVRARECWDPVEQQGCVSPGEKDRELLVEVSDGLAPLLHSLPCLGIGITLRQLGLYCAGTAVAGCIFEAAKPK